MAQPSQETRPCNNLLSPRQLEIMQTPPLALDRQREGWDLINIIVSLGNFVFPFKDMAVMLYLLAGDSGGEVSRNLILAPS